MDKGSPLSTTGRRHRARGTIAVVLAGIVASAAVALPWPAAARAQAADPTEAAIQRMIELNRQALTAFAAKDYEAARSALMDAIKQGKDAGLAEDKMMARTYLHMGAVYIDGLKDRARGMRYLGMALRLRPDIKITPSLVSPTLEAAFEDARGEAQNPGAVAAAPEPRPAPEPAPAPVRERAPPPPPPEPVAQNEPEPASEPGDDGEPDIPAAIPQPVYCPNPDEAPPHESIFLRCVIKSEVPAAKVFLFYRLPGEEKFLAAKMSRSRRGWWSGSIPGRAVVGKSLQYYVEARDASGQEAATNGRNDSPNLMLVREGAPSLAEGTLAGTRSGTRRRRSRAADEEENPLEAQERERERSSGLHRRGARSFWIGLGLGTAYGWHRATRLEFRTDLKVEAGLAAAGLLYLAPEVGYQFTDSFGVSLQGRHQFIPEQKSDTLDSHEGAPATGAHSLLAKASYFAGSGNLQLVISGIFGGGEGFRLVIPPRPTTDPTTTLPRNDTVRGGPFVAGAAATILYHFSAHAALALELKGLAGFPDSGRVADFGLGMQFGL
jgi:hypothetical protein